MVIEKLPYRGRVNSCNVAQRPSDCLHDEELLGVRVRVAYLQNERYIGVAFPTSLMLDGGAIEPEIVRA